LENTNDFFIWPHDGSWYALFTGSSDCSSVEQTLSQSDVTIDPGAPLTFMMRMGVSGLFGNVSGTLNVKIDNDIVMNFTHNTTGYDDYKEVTVDTSGYDDGGQHTISFTSDNIVVEESGLGDYLFFCVDKVTLAASPCTAKKGDFDNDDDVDLTDVILATQVLAGFSPEIPCPDDIDGDMRVGPAEVLFTLQAVAEWQTP
jgi:hypothetical protein